MKRLFVAIDPPDDVKQQLENVQEPFNGLRWQNSDNYHLTLKFIGDTPVDQQQRIEETIADITADSFNLTINGLGYFPPNRHPRVIWAGVEEIPELMQLQTTIEERLADLGIEKENRDYHPHITIGKNKEVQRHKVEEFIDRHGDFKIPGIPVSEFILYSSELTSEGAVHTSEKSIPLF